MEQYYRDDLTTQSAKIFRLNRFANLFGLLSALGLSVVANFREIELFKIHLLGAMMAFGFGATYCWLQTLALLFGGSTGEQSSYGTVASGSVGDHLHSLSHYLHYGTD